MDVDDEDVEEEIVENGLLKEMGKRGGGPTQTSTRAAAEANGVPNMGEFTPEEALVAKKGAAGVANRLLYPEAIISRNIKVRARNAETRKAFANTDNKRAVVETIAQIRGR